MTSSAGAPPNESAAVRAAVEQERRFGDVESGIKDVSLKQDYFFKQYDNDQKAQRERDEEILKVARAALAASDHTNGTVAECVMNIARLDSLVVDQGGDIEELSGGLHATHAELVATKGDVAALQGTQHDGKLVSDAQARTLSNEWKLVLAVLFIAGTIPTLLGSWISLADKLHF